VNAWRAPQRILLGHGPNQGAGIGGDGRSPVASGDSSMSRIGGSPGDARGRRSRASRSRRPFANRPMRATATPRATDPLSPGAAVEVWTVAAPAVDAGVRGPRSAARHVTGSSLGALRERKSAQTSSRPEPTGSPSASSMRPTSTELLAGTSQ
jgi:hypothetical protein